MPLTVAMALARSPFYFNGLYSKAKHLFALFSFCFRLAILVWGEQKSSSFLVVLFQHLQLHEFVLCAVGCGYTTPHQSAMKSRAIIIGSPL